MTVTDAAAEIRQSADSYLDRTGHGEQVNPILLKQLSVSIARSRQSDKYIAEQGEVIAYISLGYIAQASSLWGQVMGAITGEGVHDDEDNY